MIDTMNVYEIHEALQFNPETDTDVQAAATESYFAECELEMAAMEGSYGIAMENELTEKAEISAEKFMNFVRAIVQKMIQWASAAVRTLQIAIMKVQKKNAQARVDKMKNNVSYTIPARIQKIIAAERKNILAYAPKCESLMSDVKHAMTQDFNDLKNKVIKIEDEMNDILDRCDKASGDVYISAGTILEALTESMTSAKKINNMARMLDNEAKKIAKESRKDKDEWDDRAKLGNARWAINKTTSIAMRACRTVFGAAISASKKATKAKN